MGCVVTRFRVPFRDALKTCCVHEYRMFTPGVDGRSDHFVAGPKSLG